MPGDISILSGKGTKLCGGSSAAILSPLYVFGVLMCLLLISPPMLHSTTSIPL